MTAVVLETLPIRSEEDVVRVRHAVRKVAVDVKLSLVEQTKIVTAASELARNTLIHGGGGGARVERIELGGRVGVRLTFEDQGPGIPDVTRALQDGFTTGGGLGLGLGGAKRLMSDFAVQSSPGHGTRVVVTKWK